MNTTRARENTEDSKPSGRRRKRDVHGRGRLKLNTPEIQGYVCRWVNDVDNKLHEKTVFDDFDFVLRREIGDQVGDTGKGNNDLGAKVRTLVGKNEDGQPIYAYLLKKKREYHEEDIIGNERARRGRERTLRKGTTETGKPLDEQYGEIT